MADTVSLNCQREERMLELLFFTVCLLACTAGSICGIGGGVIIKPVLDATGVMSVTSISFLSGCTVLSMAVVSVYKALKNKTASIDLKLATYLALGACVGGITGKMLFDQIKQVTGNDDQVGLIQAIVLVIITVGTIVYTLKKEQIKTCHFKNLFVSLIIGFLLGMMSSFLGIGGGPINLVVLGFFFSMKTKEAALCSVYIILFSQLSSFLQTVLTNNIPSFAITTLIVMIAGGILGGFIGSFVNKKISTKNVDKLFILLMVIIVFINFYNIYRFGF